MLCPPYIAITWIYLLLIINTTNNKPETAAYKRDSSNSVLREKHEQGLLASIEFLKHLLILARDVAKVEREVVPEPELDKGIAALTELFNGVKNDKTPIIVERIVADIDGIVKIVRFDGWKDTSAGKQEVRKALRSVIWVKYKIKDNDVFDKAYNYIEMYY
jgi:type I restriction enzyme R subunit